MNQLVNGTTFILPPRCACRFTLALLWKYGLEEMSYHHFLPEELRQNSSPVYMNIRNPYTRLRSWWRLYNTLDMPTGIDDDSRQISFEDYIRNLHTQEYAKPKFVLIVDEHDRRKEWWYPIPMTNYLLEADKMNIKIDAFIRQECLAADLERVGYPVKDFEYKQIKYIQPPDKDFDTYLRAQIRSKRFGDWEPNWDSTPDLDVYRENPDLAEIIRLYYRPDFENFGYSFDVEDLKDPGFDKPHPIEDALPNAAP